MNRSMAGRIVVVLVVGAQLLFQFDLLYTSFCTSADKSQLISVAQPTTSTELTTSPELSSNIIAQQQLQIAFPATSTATPDAPVHAHSYTMLETDLKLIQRGNKEKEVQQTHAAGKLCFFGGLDNLDETISVFTRLLAMGQQLQRIVVIPPYLFNLFDPYLMEMDGSVEISKNQAYCDPRALTPNITMPNFKRDTTNPPRRRRWEWLQQLTLKPKTVQPTEHLNLPWPNTFRNQDDAVLYIGGLHLKQHGNEVIKSATQQNMLDQLLFTNLYPFKETRMRVSDFVAEHFHNKPFVAVHLDSCDGNGTISSDKGPNLSSDSSSVSLSGAFSSWLSASANVLKSKISQHSWCADITPSLLRWVLEEHASGLVYAPIYISTTAHIREHKSYWIDAFRAMGAVVFEESDCPRLYECDMINREIAARSAFFYSSRQTDTTKYISNMRQWRNNGSPFTQHASLVRSFAVAEAKSIAGWAPLQPNYFTLTPAPTTPIQTPETKSHYQSYLTKLEGQSLIYPREEHFPRNGVLCQLGTFEQLNNVLDQTAALLYIARKLKRTVVVAPLVSQLYDVSYIEKDRPFPRLKARDGTWYTPPRVSTNVSLCDPGHMWNFARPRKNEAILTFIRRYRRDKSAVLVMGAKDLFHYGFGKRPLFSYLHPHKQVREIAIDFIEKNFGTKPFVAVHLRFLDGHCYKVSKGDPACDLDPELLRWILQKNAPELVDAPIFVASDHQRKVLEAAFVQVGAFFYRGKCHSYDKQCMLIDEEIATRSAYFYGLHLSTASQNIERFRRQRDNGSPFEQLEAFPHLNSSTSPKPNEWTPRTWQGSDSPEKYFALRPKEDMDQVALTIAPGAPKGGGGLWSAMRGNEWRVDEADALTNAEEEEDERACVKIVRARMTPVLWLLVVVALVYTRVQQAVWYMFMQLANMGVKKEGGSVLPVVTKLKSAIPVSALEAGRRRRVFKRLTIQEVESEPSSKFD